MSASESERLELLFEMGRLLASKLELADLLKTVLELSARVVGAETASLLLLDAATQELYFDVALGLGDEAAKVRLKIGQGIAGAVAKSRVCEIINDVRADSRWSPKMDEQTGFVTRSILAAPILLKGRLLGVVEAINKRGGGFDEADRSAFEAFASQAAVAIENARLFASLREERFKLETVFSQMQDGAVLTDEGGGVLLANAAAARLLGAAPRGIAAAFAGLAVVPSVLELMSPFKSEIPFTATRQEPTLFVLAGHSTRAPLSSGEGRLFVFRDDTEAHRQELLKRSFLSLVSHKLKTPLAVVIGFSDLLLADLDPKTTDPRKYQAVRSIREQSAKVGVLLEKVLRYVAVEDPEAKLALEDVKVDEAVAAAAAAVPRALERGARVETPPSGLSVRADRTLLVEALKGLIDNAVKFDEKPDPTVEIRAAADGKAVAIRVSDRGPGIPPEAHEAVFSRFHQIEKDFTGQLDGMGLGLAFVRRVAALHGGSAALESTLGRGATVVLRLPGSKPA